MTGLVLTVRMQVPRIHQNIITAWPQTSRVVEKEVGIITRMFQRTHKTWSHQPSWHDLPLHISREGGGITSAVATNDIVYVWVNHPRKPGRAAFSRDYKPKTKPRTIGSGQGKGRVIARGNRAPALKKVTPREFDLEIQERRQQPTKFVRKAMRAVRNDVIGMFGGNEQVVRVTFF